MKLIGMLDSPYVRRTAICLDIFSIPFEHYPLSTFRDIEKFSCLNPVLKAPTLFLNDGTLLMDSSLIIHQFEMTVSPHKRLLPTQAEALSRTMSTVGLALAACEKAVQIVYEGNRPAEKLYQDWLDRISNQLKMALQLLEKSLSLAPFQDGAIDLADITSAVAWTFIQHKLPELINPVDFPALHTHTKRLEEIESFKRYKFPYQIDVTQ